MQLLVTDVRKPQYDGSSNYLICQSQKCPKKACKVHLPCRQFPASGVVRAVECCCTIYHQKGVSVNSNTPCITCQSLGILAQMRQKQARMNRCDNRKWEIQVGTTNECEGFRLEKKFCNCFQILKDGSHCFIR